MTRELSSFLPVRRGTSALRERFLADPSGWLPAGSRAAGPEAWSLVLRFHGLTRRVRAEIGQPWVSGSTVWRSLSWQPEPHAGDPAPLDRMLPDFRGELGLHAPEGAASLVLTGHYEPPGARIGELVDAVLLHRVAQRTATTFLAEIGSSLHAARDVSRAPT